MTQNKKEIKYAFALNDTDIEEGIFDSVEELIQYAQKSWDSMDGNPFDEDCEYSGLINIMVADILEPYEFAPSLDDIADQITDALYSSHNVDCDEDVKVRNEAEAKKDWEAFVNKYFRLPFNVTSNCDIGTYDLVNHKWVKKIS